MGFEAGTEVLTCPRCGTVHQARWERMPVREIQTVSCEACTAVMFSGKSVKDYVAISIIQP